MKGRRVIFISLQFQNGDHFVGIFRGYITKFITLLISLIERPEIRLCLVGYLSVCLPNKVWNQRTWGSDVYVKIFEFPSRLKWRPFSGSLSKLRVSSEEY